MWICTTVALATYLGYSMTAPPSYVSRTFLPGETTHGHYQIELSCRSCHTPNMGVRQESCLECHEAELKQAQDTHPKSKFTDPSNAPLLEVIDARLCTSCHEEHVPERTHPMGLSLPQDYCYQCHQTIVEDRPSHKGLTYNTCATAGCHNFHDNRALYENFLAKHGDGADLLDDPRVDSRNLRERTESILGHPMEQLNPADADAPENVGFDAQLVTEWATSAHATVGVNCSDCHTTYVDDDDSSRWSATVEYQQCESCHSGEVQGFLAGRHGMRLAAGLTPMSPAMARLPMREESILSHRHVTCNACHRDHRFDTEFAAVEACLQCHDDDHSRAYKQSSHYRLWQDEQLGETADGIGVSCATCHMPRLRDSQFGVAGVVVQHNQNDNLRPNEKMIRSACMNCHGLQYSLDSLADDNLIHRNFNGSPAETVRSIEMVKTWFETRRTRSAGHVKGRIDESDD